MRASARYDDHPRFGEWLLPLELPECFSVNVINVDPPGLHRILEKYEATFMNNNHSRSLDDDILFQNAVQAYKSHLTVNIADNMLVGARGNEWRA